MTREEKLYSMRMQDLELVADKLGIKINKKAAKSKAVEKILEAEGKSDDAAIEKMKKTQEKKQQESDKAAEDAVNKPKAEPVNGLKPKRGALIEYNGKSQNICAWAKELGKSANTLYGRIYKMGWSVEDAFTK